MTITDIDFLLMADGTVRVVLTLLVPQSGQKPPLRVKLEKDIDYSSWATACLVIALGYSDDDNEDPDDDGTRH